MNYRDARELSDENGKPTGRFHYTNMNDGRIYPIGYCQKGVCDHKTKEEAFAHYKEYLLNERLNLTHGTLAGMKLKCEAKDGCEEYTDVVSSAGGMDQFHLCDKHRTKEEIAKILVVAQEMSSF